MRNLASIRRGLFAVLGLALTFSIAQPAAAAIISGSVIEQNSGEVVATYRGNSAQFSNDLYLESPDGFFRSNIIFNNHASLIGSSVSLGSFTAGTEHEGKRPALHERGRLLWVLVMHVGEHAR